MRKKVLILCNSASGLFDFRGTLLSRLKEAGCAVICVVPDSGYEEKLCSAGAKKVIRLQMNRRGMNPLQDIALYRAYRTIIRKMHPDIVLTYTIKPNIYGGMGCRKEGVPYISTVTGLGSVFDGKGAGKQVLRHIVTPMYRAAMKDCRCLFFQNKESRHVFAKLKIKAKKTRLVAGSGVDLQRFSPVEPPVCGNGKDGLPVRFSLITRLLREKGVEEYLASASAIRKKYPQTEFHICGYREAGYDGLPDRAIADQTVIYHGERADIPAFLQTIHCVIHPSYYPEGLSNVLLEAQAAARAVITTDHTGCREAIEDGVTGFLVPVKDADALTDAIERFLALSYEEKRAMGLAGRGRMEELFDRRQVTEAYMEEIGAKEI